ncbi:hypothetical protein BC828DRAFT_379187 [Blastocladiella britannica]|nr:hypothetical protein BC828DRAFT_379187 [Blastocladiella britannica]
MNDPAAALVQQIESWCDDFSVPATRAVAERGLLQFRATPGIHRNALHVALLSTHASARHHAAMAVAESLLRTTDPSVLATDGPECLGQLLSACMQTNDASKHGTSALSFATKSMLTAAATISKRLYPTQEPLVRQVLSQLSQSPQPMVALAFARALLDVIGDATVAPAALPNFHAQCKAHFEARDLAEVLQLACGTIEHVAAVVTHENGSLAAPLPPALDVRLGLALEVLEKTLSWEFSGGEAEARSQGGDEYESAAAAAAAADRDDYDLAPVPLPAAWAPVVAAPSFVGALFAWAVGLGQRSSDPSAAVKLHRIFASVRILCCAPALAAALVSSPSTATNGNGDGRVVFCDAVVQGMRGCLRVLTAASHFATHLLTGISGTVRALLLHFPVDQVLVSVGGFWDLMAEVAQVTVSTVRQSSRANRSEEERTGMEEASAELIGMWARLADQTVRLEAEHRAPPGLSAHLGPLASAIVVAFAECKAGTTASDTALNDPYQSTDSGDGNGDYGDADFSDDDSDDMGLAKDWEMYEDVLCDLAQLARLDPAHNAAMYSQHLAAALARLHPTGDALSAGQAAAHLDAVHWLLLLSSTFLADAPAGEVPMVPMSFFSSPDAGAAVRDLVQHLMHSLATVLAHPHLVSPLVVESAWRATARLIPTYVMPNVSDYYDPRAAASPLLSTFGTGAADFLVENAGRTLAGEPAWRGEADVQAGAAAALLALAKNPRATAHLKAAPGFAALTQSVAALLSAAPGIAATAEGVTARYTEAVVRVATSSSGVDVNHGAEAIVGLVVREVEALGALPVAQLREGQQIMRLTRTLEIMDGIARAMDYNNVAVLAPPMVHFCGILPGILATIGPSSELWPSVLDVFVHVYYGDKLAMMPDETAVAIAESFVSVVRQYAQSDLGSGDAAHQSAAAAMAADEERWPALVQILEVLQALAEDADRLSSATAAGAVWQAIGPFVTDDDALGVPSVAVRVAEFVHTRVTRPGAATELDASNGASYVQVLAHMLGRVAAVIPTAVATALDTIAAGPIVTATAAADGAAMVAATLVRAALALVLFSRLSPRRRHVAGTAVVRQVRHAQSVSGTAPTLVVGACVDPIAAAASPETAVRVGPLLEQLAGLLERACSMGDAGEAEFHLSWAAWLAEARAALN